MDSTFSSLDSGLGLSVRQAVSHAVHNTPPGSSAAREEGPTTEQLRRQQQRLQQERRSQAADERRSALAEAEGPAPGNRAVRFRLNREAERIYIEVVDRSTGEIVKQIPPERLLRLAESLRQLTGNLLDESA
ncbi:MAG TPA: flagellar protein FlaG [Acidobacteriota bacterium]|nr:flagellar protein FlaG [Acidobacteriota bacterium]